MSNSDPIVDEHGKRVARLAATLKGTAERTRVSILYLLAEEPRSAKAICQALGLMPPAASHHLAHMKLLGMIDAERLGQFVIYSLTDLGMRLLEAIERLIPRPAA